MIVFYIIKVDFFHLSVLPSLLILVMDIMLFTFYLFFLILS